jgi:hypothetical protein
MNKILWMAWNYETVYVGGKKGGAFIETIFAKS